MLATLAVAAALIGTPVSQDGERRGTPLTAPTLLDPVTLQPVMSAPELPSTRVDTAPDGSATAAKADTGVDVFDRATGKRTAHVDLPSFPGGTILAWLTPDRLLVFQCEGLPGYPDTCPDSYIQVVDPVAGRLVRSVTLEGAGIAGMSKLGDRVLLMQSVPASFGLQNPSLNDPRNAVVIDAEGAIAHKFDFKGYLSGPLVIGGQDFPSQGQPGNELYRIDVQTGAVKHRTLKGFAGSWVWGDPGGTRYLEYGYKSDYMGIDPRTLKTIRAPFHQVKPMKGLEHGYLLCCQDAETMKRVTDSGKLLWTRRVRGVVGVIGKYVYIQQGLRDGCEGDDYRVIVLSLKTGKTLAKVPGRFDLLSPHGGVDYYQEQRLSGSDLFCDDD